MNLMSFQTARGDAPSLSAIVSVLGVALDAYRDGTLDELLHQRAVASRWLSRHYLQPILGSAGDALPGERQVPAAAALLLEWAVTQLRPDRLPSLTIAEREHWLDRTSWRPAIAIMCHFRFISVPDFRDRYYRRSDESPADNLCGLWNIGQSTFYRYLDKGKRGMAQLLYEQRLDGRHTISLREYAKGYAYRVHGLTSPKLRAEWHIQQAGRAAQNEDHLSAAWHLCEARTFSDWRAYVNRHVTAFAGQPEFALYLRHLTEQSILLPGNLDLELVHAMLARASGTPDRERESYERALRHATDANDRIATAVVYSHLGKHYESRDPDRALAYYRESASALEPLVRTDDSGQTATREIANAYVEVLVKLAWLYVLRNDPRAQAVLESAQAVQAETGVDDSTAALLAQAWGEYWRRAKQFDKSLDHRLRALVLYERLGDQEGVIKTLVNIGLTYVDQNRLDKAVETYRQVFGMIEGSPVSQEIVASAYVNLGICYYLQGDFDAAIEQYESALALSQSQGLTLIGGRAHEGLAEAYFRKFLKTGDPADESCGDAHVEAAIHAYLAMDSPGYADIVRKLKEDILNSAVREQTNDRLLPQETAVHYAEMAEIERQRGILAMPGRPEDHVRAHLAIANAYLAISVKERETALALIEKYGLGDRFADEFERLRTTFESTLTREQRLDAVWRVKAGDLLNDSRRTAVLRHLIEHQAINKSSYAALCHVGLATASKHLGHLARLGLLRQIGRGPSTHYVLL